jgi:hypothetical protein
MIRSNTRRASALPRSTGLQLWALGIALSLVASRAALADAGPPGMVAPQVPQVPQTGDAGLPSDDRRPSDERLFLIPTPQTMQPGSLSLSDDAVLLVRAAAGISRRVQLDLRLGALPIPGAAGGALPLPGGIVAGGGAGLVVLGLVDVGIKVRILPETPERPGLAVSYDLVDAFAGAVGGAGIALAGAGAAGGGVVAVGGGNLQFNLFSLSVGKHVGRFQFVAGTYVLDNHHFLPQSTRFATACGAGGVGAAGDGGKVEPCGSGGTTIDRIPVQVQPFLGAELRVGKASSLAADVLLSSEPKDTVGTTGFRWILGQSRLRARIDLALLWSHIGVPLPWLGLGLHLQ